MKCHNCGIEIHNMSDNCPLCGKLLTETGEGKNTIYPDVKKLKNKGQTYTVRFLLFITIVLCLSSYIVNILTPHVNLWSIISIYGMWLAWLTVGIPIIRKRLSLLIIIIDDIMISIFLYIVDITFGNLGWAMNYAVPFVLCGSAMVMTVIVLSTKINWREFYLFQLAIVVICFIPLIIRMYRDFIFWPSIVSAAYGIITFIGLIVLSSRRLSHETKKRLHF